LFGLYYFGAAPVAGFADAGAVAAAFDGATCTVRFLLPLALAAAPSLANG
jgi:hypothetical protein